MTDHKRLQRLIYGTQNPTPEQERILESILDMANRPPTGREKFKGGMIEVMSRFPSWSNERHTLSALRAKIPYELSAEIRDAAEKEVASDAAKRVAV